MARVVIIGASKGIGLETTRQALEAGHMVVCAFARSAADISISDPKLERVRGNALRRRHGGGQGDERCDPGVGRRSR